MAIPYVNKYCVNKRTNLPKSTQKINEKLVKRIARATAVGLFAVAVQTIDNHVQRGRVSRLGDVANEF